MFFTFIFPFLLLFLFSAMRFFADYFSFCHR
nr:MAG TPA: hypothetical protein [Caudoviricetes sp.]